MPIRRACIERAASYRRATVGCDFPTPPSGWQTFADCLVAMSRSKLRGITRKIKAALVNILHLAKTQQPAIDYNALTTLSNASRIDAIRTMDDLSQRLQRPSHASLRSSSSKSSATSKSRSRKHGKRHSSEQEEVPSVDTRKRPTAQKSEGRSKGRESSRRSSSDSQSPICPPPDLQIKSKPAAPDVVTKRAPGKLVKQSPHQETVVHNRISYVSISSDSTKLGEIPYRGSRLVRHHDSDGASISQQATYPLYTYKPAHHEKTGLFRRLFR